MKIALIGYGKMGKAIEEVILEEKKHDVILKISENNIDEFTVENLKKADVAIDFTQPESAFGNVMKCFEANVPIVVGTTSWEEGLKKATSYCLEHNKTLFVSPNFSIGVNLFFKLNRELARIMGRHDNYKLSMTEIHHTEKKDAPSGTAIKLANDIISNQYLSYTEWSLGTANNDYSIPIQSIREQGVPGTHLVNYTSEIDQIEIIHTAKNRKGFAVGAVRAAEFIYGKVGCFDMENLLDYNEL